ncbi:hypothetical protein DFS34DRAFT_689182 [Phlyctochytrium arcticum]|nr:hypothetical protein DFS34DRAFT_689182 [Phlyctochytrium arcticum]
MSGLNSRSANGLRNLNSTIISDSFISGELKGDEYSSINVAKLSNTNGEMKVNYVSSQSPLSTSLSKGEATTSLNIDPHRLNITEDNLLTTIDPSYEVPLSCEENDSNNGRTIALLIDEDSLFVNQENQLAARIPDPPELNSPLFYNDDDQIELRYASHMEDAESILDGDLNLFAKGLSLKISDPFYYNVLNSHKLSLKIDSETMDIDGGELKARIPDKLVFEYPLDEIDGQVSLRIDEDTLEVDDNKLKAKIQDVSKSLKGAGAISVYRDITESIDGSLVNSRWTMKIFSRRVTSWRLEVRD